MNIGITLALQTIEQCQKLWILHLWMEDRNIHSTKKQKPITNFCITIRVFFYKLKQTIFYTLAIICKIISDSLLCK